MQFWCALAVGVGAQTLCNLSAAKARRTVGQTAVYYKLWDVVRDAEAAWVGGCRWVVGGLSGGCRWVEEVLSGTGYGCES